MFSLNGTLKKSGSVGRWETKQFIGMTLFKKKKVPEICWRHPMSLKKCTFLFCYQNFFLRIFTFLFFQTFFVLNVLISSN